MAIILPHTVGAIDAEDAVLEILLHPPTEREALADQLGTQSVPERCVLQGANAIAAFAGAAASREWGTLRDRAAAVRAAFAGRAASIDVLAAAIRTHGRALQLLAEADFTTLVLVVEWLSMKPASGWSIRQLPIRGIDTKWLERHRAVVESLHAAISGRGFALRQLVAASENQVM